MQLESFMSTLPVLLIIVPLATWLSHIGCYYIEMKILKKSNAFEKNIAAEGSFVILVDRKHANYTQQLDRDLRVIRIWKRINIVLIITWLVGAIYLTQFRK
jgi:hypothetical protein